MTTKTSDQIINAPTIEKFLINTNYYLNGSRELVLNANNSAALKTHEPAIRKAFDELAIVMTLPPSILEQARFKHANVQKVLTEISDNINQKTVVTALHTLGIRSIPKFSFVKPDSKWFETLKSGMRTFGKRLLDASSLSFRYAPLASCLIVYHGNSFFIPITSSLILAPVVTAELMDSIAPRLFGYKSKSRLANLAAFALVGTIGFAAMLALLISPTVSSEIAQTFPRLGLAVSCLKHIGIIAATAIGSMHALKDGMKNFDKKANFKNRLWGAILLGAGTAGIASALYAFKNLSFGLSRFYSLDPSQQYFAIKHDLIPSLGESGKTCRAVVIDGLSSKWAWRKGLAAHSDDVNAPFLAALSSHCNLRVYRDEKENPICTAIEKGRTELGGKLLDLVVINGHANEEEICLGPAPNTWDGPDSHVLSSIASGPHREETRKRWENAGIDWKRARERSEVDWERAAECLKKNVAPEGQIILAGCNTATGVGSITELLANATNRETTGFAAFMSPVLTTVSWAHHKAFFWSTSDEDSQGYPVHLGENIVRSFAPHHETCPIDRAVLG